MFGFLFGGPRRQARYRNQGLFGNLFGGNQYRYQPRRRGLLSNPLVGMLAMGALGYAAKRFLGGNNRGYNSGSFDAGGGGSVWGQGSDNGSNNFPTEGNGQSW
jgi:hypothetical protein